MTQADFGIALLLFLIATGFTLFVFFGPYRREKKVAQVYKLYKVRDDLVYLVAQGKLQENDLLFERFYQMVNLFIQKSDHLTLGSIVQALHTAREKKLDPTDDEIRKKIHASLQDKDQEVGAIIFEFYRAVIEILKDNSLLVRLMSRYAWIASAIQWFAETTKNIRFTPPQREAYQYYRDYTKVLDQAV